MRGFHLKTSNIEHIQNRVEPRATTSNNDNNTNSTNEVCIEESSMCSALKMMSNRAIIITREVSQQQNPGSSTLKFAPYQQSTMPGVRHAANNNSDRRPPFENEQSLASSQEQHQIHQQKQPSQLGHPMTFDDMVSFTGSASMNLMGNRHPAAAIVGPNIDPKLLDYPQQNFQQAGGLSAISNYMFDNSTHCQQMDNGMTQYGADPWDSREIFEAMGVPTDSYYGGHPIKHQRSSLTREIVVFPRTQMLPSPQSEQRAYLGQFDSSSAPPPSGMIPDSRILQPSLIYGSNGNTPSRALAAPLRSMGPLPATARSGSGSVTCQPQINQGRKRPVPSFGPSRNEAIRKKTISKTPHCSRSPIAGENRLKISFIGLGTLGEAPQYFGTKGYIIPNGLAGMHQVYHQRWRFDTSHVKIEDVICVSLSITNLTSGTTWQRTETPGEAYLREKSGNTICNQFLRHALKSRAAELEAELVSLRDNTVEFLNTVNMINALKPKFCILGLLFFGLLHDTVQQRMRDLLGNTTPLHQMVPTNRLAEEGNEIDGKAVRQPSGSDGDFVST